MYQIDLHSEYDPSCASWTFTLYRVESDLREAVATSDSTCYFSREAAIEAARKKASGVEMVRWHRRRLAGGGERRTETVDLQGCHA